MTGLNKLRSEFEAQHSDKVFKIVKFDEATNAYCLHAHLPLTEINLSALAEINYGWDLWQKAKAQAVPQWINVEVGVPVNFGTRVKIKRKSWDEEDNLIFVESEATYDKDSDFCELSNRTYEYETWFDHELKKYLEEDEITHWAPLDKSESGAEG
ncbi:hypothetical protein P1D17_004165 [Acinetobacter baumannii]|uniref:hypothetical protein n=1 Tax=Acinetobacter baumannii TaxID=470 RepID=UPI00044AC516|nr:hypothetical protein [Acinetobacter baumannii]EXF17947.1 hypothetical protein J601_3096 [Acinetobacter baumannii 831240]KQG99735.1 hypothetical protein APC58_15395 [Acinetobacter baumannii]MCT9447806.1 hypothetical protein [Acinetobacter baumannii]MDF9673331.1 hypothetical protein [Acinetobacter baumannii]MDF9688045.1 hypothetical protein [Acinetobacter baumannii]